MDPDANLTVWIATIFDRANESYVSLLESASLVTDPAAKERHWQSRWAQHYP